MIFDPEKRSPIDPADNASVADFSVYEGRNVGSVAKTYVRGELLVDDGELIGNPGYGQFVKREIPTWQN